MIYEAIPCNTMEHYAIPCKTMKYHAFFHHYQGSIDFNIVNIHPTAAMYLFVSTGNRNDIE